MENFIAVLFLETAAATPTFRNHLPNHSAIINMKVRTSTLLKAQVTAHFSSKVVFTVKCIDIFFRDNTTAHLIDCSIV